ncbi:MAG: serine/threonine-protein kinase [Planctomycetota bacterium]
MTSEADVPFLALLVHRGHLDRGQAEVLLPELKLGRALDRLLVDRFGWTPDRVARLRRTRAGEIPEIPGYEIQGKLGSGGTADVFRAREKKTGRILALKVLKEECARNKATLAAFVSEARLLEKLKHPGLVECFGVARSGETYFSKLECIEGSTLLEMLDLGQPFSEDAALRAVLAAAEVLAYLAGENVVHRDVKPGNLMLAHDGRIKLIDLGFAGTPDAARNRQDRAVGTVAYLSPEQAQGGAAADPRSDVYSLGVTLFHLVVGRLPFESSDDQEILRMQVMQSLSSPELKSRGLSPHLHYFVEKMMAKQADLRYQSWGELLEDIRGQIRGREQLDFDRDGGGETTASTNRPPRKRRRF